MSDVKARVLPGLNEADNVADNITVYVVTGRHGLLRIPASFCEECHLFVRAARKAQEETDTDVSVSVMSWWTHFLRPLIHGGYHPPILMVGDEVVAQGYNVPTAEELIDIIEE